MIRICRCWSVEGGVLGRRERVLLDHLLHERRVDKELLVDLRGGKGSPGVMGIRAAEDRREGTSLRSSL